MIIRTALLSCLLALAMVATAPTATAGGYVSIHHGYGLSTYRPGHHGLSHRYKHGYQRGHKSGLHRGWRHHRHDKRRHFNDRYGYGRFSYGYPRSAGGLTLHLESGRSSIHYSIPLYREYWRY